MQPNPFPTFTERSEAFGALPKRMRQERGLTQVEVAQLAGISPVSARSYIGEIESGKRKPSRAQLDRLCAALGFDRDDTHAMLGLIPLEIEENWLTNTSFRTQVRILAAAQEG